MLQLIQQNKTGNRVWKTTDLKNTRNDLVISRVNVPGGWVGWLKSNGSYKFNIKN